MSLLTWGSTQIHSETLRKRVRQAEADSGKRGDLLFNNRRLHEALEDRPPRKVEELYAVKARAITPTR